MKHVVRDVYWHQDHHLPVDFHGSELHGLYVAEPKSEEEARYRRTQASGIGLYEIPGKNI